MTELNDEAIQAAIQAVTHGQASTLSGAGSNNVQLRVTTPKGTDRTAIAAAYYALATDADAKLLGRGRDAQNPDIQIFTATFSGSPEDFAAKIGDEAQAQGHGLPAVVRELYNGVKESNSK